MGFQITGENITAMIKKVIKCMPAFHYQGATHQRLCQEQQNTAASLI